MKKALSLILVLAFLLSCSCGAALAADSKIVPFTPTMTNLGEKSAKEWFSSAETRALFTILLYLDLPENVRGKYDSSKSWVLKDGMSLMLFVLGEEDSLAVVYTPATEYAAYSRVGVTSETMAKLVLEGYSGDGYYKNDIEDLYTIAQLLSEALEG
ncbi:MAG: hypothetical protein IKE30_09170 [Clostridia bacterium]|nr:hypothetical protein [Clostridia bacterium]